MNFAWKRGERFGPPLNSKREKRHRWLVLSGLLLIVLPLLVYFFKPSSRPVEVPAEGEDQKTPPPEEPQQHVIEGTVKGGGTLFKSLTEKGIPVHWIELIIRKLEPYLNFRRIKGGTYRFVTDGEGELVKFLYEAGPAEVYEVGKDGQGYVAQKKEVPLETYLVKVEGEIRSSLFEAVDAAGEQDPLVISFAEILAWEIDFYKDVKEGDRFKVIVEKVYKGDVFIRYGPIHAVQYQSGEKVIRGIGYGGDFYHERGVSLRKAFLRTPLRFNRISSRFSRARKHPILGGVRPHFGVDYAAPTGTPIWAVADGTVASCGWSGGFGKQVILRHPNGYVTCYGHLSGYGPKIRKGAPVRQKQILGYVGSTGLSTGPHLDYRLVKAGQFRNPLKERFPAGVPIERDEMEKFQMRRDEILACLNGEASFRKRIN